MTIEEKREKNRLKNILWRHKNRVRYNKLISVWRSNNRHKEKDYKLRTRYGISFKDYNALVELQDGKCKICGNQEIARHNFTKHTQSLAVDHCHVTGKVRGLLCQDCNRGLGKFHDDPVRLQKAIDYLTT